MGQQSRGGIVAQVEDAVNGFVAWLDRYGELSWDFQTVYAWPYGRWAKGLYYSNRGLGTLAVAPLVLCEALVPRARTFMWRPQRFPIGDAHYAMGFARRYRATGDQRDYTRAVHFLDVLSTTAIRTPSGLAWGYPFDWVTMGGTLKEGTPLITTVPYVYQAFAAVHAIDGDPRWTQTMRAIADHVLEDYRTIPIAPGVGSSAYTPLPEDQGQVVNASAYRAALLIRASRDLADERYSAAAVPNLRFVLQAQNGDGSWFYAMDGKRSFIDHYHTCFVLKALLAIDAMTDDGACGEAIDRGLDYYVAHLFDADSLPRPFAKAPRLTFYRRELYDYAECINLLSMVEARRPGVEARRDAVIGDLMHRWRHPSGCFRTRQLRVGWDEVPMHRWAQAQLFRSLCGVLRDKRASGDATPSTSS